MHPRKPEKPEKTPFGHGKNSTYLPHVPYELLGVAPCHSLSGRHSEARDGHHLLRPAHDVDLGPGADGADEKCKKLKIVSERVYIR